MQKIIFKNKNIITVISATLISLSFMGHWILKDNFYSEFMLIIASVIGVLPIAIQAYQALKVKVVSIDVLVTIAVVAAFAIRNFEESAIVTFLFLFGSYLEKRTLNKTRKAIKELTEMAPETALKLTEDNKYIEVGIEEVTVGDMILVKTGAKVPVDGIVISGEGSVNEASITGESLPVSKSVDSKVYAGTILDNGTIAVNADRVGVDTTFGKIIELVVEAQDSKSEAERFIDRFSKYYTPLVLLVAFFVWLFTRNIELAITILVLGCPGALVIGVPVSNVAGIGNGARHGILLKGSEVIGYFSKVDTIIFDKTGTVTIGKPVVSETIYYGEKKESDLLYLASIERESDHPLANAILESIPLKNYIKVDKTEVIKGKGISAAINDDQILVGNYSLMKEYGINVTEEMIDDIERLELQGNSIVITVINNDIKIIVGVKDQIRDKVKEDIELLKRLKVKNLVMLSGDNQGTVDLVSKELDLTESHGNMLPEEKAEFVENRIENDEIVAFVGDGVNDSPSLALAHVGIAMGSGTDVAIETSDVVLMNSNFSKLPHALALTKATARNMKQNIVIALAVVFILVLGVMFSNIVSMSVGMLVHEASILVVILNGMRLLRFNMK
ncbi:heavy metal translocating P-type ATPase [Vagococcus elongatus]|uniref:Cd(2+)-exporting ATPase n=1 Tax=Vagococcus elongatus TaxID=180344 RepID=A0A430ASF4_9ENTE|nr:heavy metal translocating P-type ATPase [Vagococcus elongatus]RSU10992.1 heavy metal translocating P-type ATPase [Vagococcus elongatus]